MNEQKVAWEVLELIQFKEVKIIVIDHRKLVQVSIGTIQYNYVEITIIGYRILIEVKTIISAVNENSTKSKMQETKQTEHNCRIHYFVICI